MAAPLGFKTFATGDVLTAADTNGYLMQGVWTFANSAARTAAVTSPQEGNVSFLKDTNSFEIYDGAAWVAYGSGDITGVTAGTGISGGGTSGDVTITNSMATAIDAKGDLIAGTGADAFSRLAVGTNNHVLTADSTTATGLKWAAVSAAPTFNTWTPTFKQGTTTFGITANDSYYFEMGEYVFCVADFLVNTGVGQSTGTVSCTLPVNSRVNASTGTRALGTIFINYSNFYPGIVVQTGTNEIKFKETLGNGVTNTVWWGNAGSGMTLQLQSGAAVGFTIMYRKA